VQPNTLNAHRLLHYGDQHDAQDAVADALFEAYFINGANLTDIDTLADIGARAGLERNALHDYLSSDADRKLVSDSDIQARSAGIGGVPFFIFNRRIGVSGAQDPETLLDAMLRAIQEPVAASGD
jgi:predicted DsbA family dithiol-disulfide isomerase